jgi:hypothetical protein
MIKSERHGRVATQESKAWDKMKKARPNKSDRNGSATSPG